MQGHEYTFDLVRIFVGDKPPLFFLEIVFRTVVLFLYLMFLFRLIGQRGVGQITLFEFALIIALGSASGDPMFQVDIPLLHGMVVILVVVLLHKTITRLNQRSRDSQKLTEGEALRLVKDGAVEINELRRSLVAPDELLMELRKSGVRFLEEVERAYFETDGTVSVFKTGQPLISGTSVLPEDQEGEDSLAIRLERKLAPTQG